MSTAIIVGCTVLASMNLISLQFAIALVPLMLAAAGLSVFWLLRIRRSGAP